MAQAYPMEVKVDVRDIPPDGPFAYIASSHQVFMFNINDIVLIETPGTEGRPLGWQEDIAAIVYFRATFKLELDADQWAQLREILTNGYRK